MKLVKEGQEVSLYVTRVGRYGSVYSLVSNASGAAQAYRSEEEAELAFKNKEVDSYHAAVKAAAQSAKEEGGDESE